jgi:hypothetical protein
MDGTKLLTSLWKGAEREKMGKAQGQDVALRDYNYYK